MTDCYQEISVALCRASTTARAVQDIKVELLARSITEVGLRQPINVRPVDGGFEVRGGGHRLAAFVKLGRETIPAFVREDDDLHAEMAEIDENLIRNEFTPIERDLAIERRKVLYELLHPETVHGATGKGRPKSRHDGDSKPAPERFSKDTSEKSGQGERTIQRSITHVEVIGKETLVDLIGTPLNSTNELDALAQLSPEKRNEVIERVKAGEDVSAKTALGQERRAKREAELGEFVRGLPDKQYGLIYADVPRHFNVHSDETGLGRSPENHYPTMSFDELLALPVSRLAASDCILVYWSTAASLIDDLDIIAEWGFITLRPRGPDGKLLRDPEALLLHERAGKYCSMQVWDKINMGLGYWFRDRHEFIIVATRGNVVAPAPGTQDQSLFSEKKGEHSAKPERIAEMIDRLWPSTPRIELFRRGEARPGWDVWGNQALAAPEEIQESEPEAQRDDTALTAAPAPSGDEPQTSAMSPCTQGDGAAQGTMMDPPPHNSDAAAIDLPNFLRVENRGKPMAECAEER